MDEVVHFSKIEPLCWIKKGLVQRNRKKNPLVTIHRSQTTCKVCISEFIDN